MCFPLLSNDHVVKDGEIRKFFLQSLGTISYIALENEIPPDF